MRPVILVVEDDGLNRGLLLDSLSRRGFEVHVVASVEELKQWMVAHVGDWNLLDVVITDMDLGDGTGWQATSKILAHTLAPGFIYMSGEPLNDALKWPGAPSSGENLRFLPKPIAHSELLEMIVDALRPSDRKWPTR